MTLEHTAAAYNGIYALALCICVNDKVIGAHITQRKSGSQKSEKKTQNEQEISEKRSNTTPTPTTPH